MVDALTYELETDYWPWGRVIDDVVEGVARRAPSGGAVADYMCGPGTLLSRLRRRRPDLILLGCDVNQEFVSHARTVHGEAGVECTDYAEFNPACGVDVAICTGGAHHVVFGRQNKVFEKIRMDVADAEQPWVVVAEDVLRENAGGADRMHAAHELNWCLVRAVIDAGAPESVIRAATELLPRDIFQEGEFKRSRAGWRRVLAPELLVHSERFVWRPSRWYDMGHVIFHCGPR